MQLHRPLKIAVNRIEPATLTDQDRDKRAHEDTLRNAFIRICISKAEAARGEGHSSVSSLKTFQIDFQTKNADFFNSIDPSRHSLRCNILVALGAPRDHPS